MRRARHATPLQRATTQQQRLVRLTTTVRLKGWRGRVYFAPVRVLHRPVTRAMLRRAAARLAASAAGRGRAAG